MLDSVRAELATRYTDDGDRRRRRWHNKWTPIAHGVFFGI
jgi:hypothetical protein